MNYLKVNAVCLILTLLSEDANKVDKMFKLPFSSKKEAETYAELKHDEKVDFIYQDIEDLANFFLNRFEK